MEQYVDRYFSLSPPRTIGVDFNPIDNIYNISGHTYNVNNHIFDTSGDIKIVHLFKSYIYKSKCILLVFDLTNIESFNNIKNWYYKIIKDLKLYKKNYKFILIGNKKDSKKKKIPQKIILDYANKLNIDYVELTAKSKNDIDGLFDKLNTDFISQFSALSPEKQSESPIIRKNNRPNTNPEKDTGCCFKICRIT
tara:strand:+ start:1865 stop:2446 length:582 start_codon:yes stop_codon:yes gene_type:complete